MISYLIFCPTSHFKPLLKSGAFWRLHSNLFLYYRVMNNYNDSMNNYNDSMNSYNDNINIVTLQLHYSAHKYLLIFCLFYIAFIFVFLSNFKYFDMYEL